MRREPGTRTRFRNGRRFRGAESNRSRSKTDYLDWSGWARGWPQRTVVAPALLAGILALRGSPTRGARPRAWVDSLRHWGGYRLLSLVVAVHPTGGLTRRDLFGPVAGIGVATG